MFPIGTIIELGDFEDVKQTTAHPRSISTYGSDPIEPIPGCQYVVCGTGNCIPSSKGGTTTENKIDALYVSSKESGDIFGEQIFWFIDITEPDNITIRQFENGFEMYKVTTITNVGICS